jgi:hypothetical protein
MNPQSQPGLRPKAHGCGALCRYHGIAEEMYHLFCAFGLAWKSAKPNAQKRE